MLIVSFFQELLELSEDRHPWESVEEKLHEIRYELLVLYFDHLSIHPSFRPTSGCPYPCPSVLASLSLPVLSPCSLPSQLLSLSFHPLLLAFHLPPSLSRHLTTVVSLLFLLFSRLSLPPSLCLFIFSTLSPFLPLFFPPFVSPYPTHHSLPSYLKSTNPLLAFDSLTVFLSGLFLVFPLTGQ